MAKAKTVTEKPFRVDYMDAEELARGLCGIENDDMETEEVEEALYKKYDISMEEFHKLVQDMFKHIAIGVSPLTEQVFIGFSKVDSRGVGTWMIKKPADSEFITSVLHWMGAEKLKKGSKGIIREITANGAIEFTITIKKES